MVKSKNYFLLENFTVKQWHEQVRTKAHFFNKKYESSFFKTKDYNLATAVSYRKLSAKYFRISSMLEHLRNYKLFIDKSCNSCLYDPEHSNILLNDLDQYDNIISRFRDGNKYDQVKQYAKTIKRMATRD